MATGMFLIFVGVLALIVLVSMILGHLKTVVYNQQLIMMMIEKKDLFEEDEEDVV